MIMIAVFAPVIVVAVLLSGVATLAMLVSGVAALGALVTACSERVFYLISKRQAARRLETGGKALEWPQPTAQTEFVYGVDFSPGLGVIDEDVLQTLRFEDPVLVPFTARDSQVAHGSGVHSWEEVFPVDEPDFEGPDAYTLIADSAEGQ